MAAPLEPARLAELVDLAERIRAGGWSFRAALCRYAQPQPERAAAVLSVLRRVESAFGAGLAELRSEGADLLARSEEAGDGTDESPLVGLLALAGELDELGTALAAWAVDGKGDRPDHQVDEVATHARTRLTELGVPEEAPPPTGSRSRG